MQDSSQGPSQSSNAQRLLWAGFMAILAAGIGFSIRGGFLDNWRAEYGFTDKEVGDINGIGFTGFCFGIIIGGIICDKIGYGKLVITAFALHVLSAVITFAPNPEMSKETVGHLLTGGSFLFALANGVLEAVANPLVATLFFSNRTHYLNILHASWPAGLVLGSASGWVLDDIYHVHWKMQFALFLIPTVLYGLMFFGQHFPKSEASQKGLSLGEMFKDVGVLGALVVGALLAMFFSSVLTPFITPAGATQEQIDSAASTATNIGYVVGGVFLIGVGVITRFSVGSFLLFTLFVTHGLVGAVELGTDSWIQNITGNILTSQEGKWLFVFTSMLMFGLRFCAEFIEKKIGLSPVGILLVCAVLACLGLNLASGIATFGGALVALTVYGIGKTFFWPTMLAVASDRFPRTGALAISIMGGVGMMSAGLIGAPGLGYAKDRFAGEALKTANATAFEDYKADKSSKFLIFADATGLDGKKLGDVQLKFASAQAEGSQSTAPMVGWSINTPVLVAILLGWFIFGTVIGLLARRKGYSFSAWILSGGLLLPAAIALAFLGDVNRENDPDIRKRRAERGNSIGGILSVLTVLVGIISFFSALPSQTDPQTAMKTLTVEEQAVISASIEGDRKTLIADSAIPATMAVIYLLLMAYFKSIGGYKPVHIDAQEALASGG